MFSEDMIREFNAPYNEHDEYHGCHYMNANLVTITGVPDVPFFHGEQILCQLSFTLTCTNIAIPSTYRSWDS
jgi:hypothetical protein